MKEKIKELIQNSKTKSVAKAGGIISLIIPLAAIAWTQINRSDVMELKIQTNKENIERIESQLNDRMMKVDEKLDRIILLLVKP